MLKTQICTHANTFTGICWLMSTTPSLKPSLCVDTKHSSQQCVAEPTALIYHVNFSNSPCSPCWPDNPCRQLQTSHTDRNGSGSWGPAQCVSGYDTPVNQMEIPRSASQRAVVLLLLLPKGATDVISLSFLQPTSQITDTSTSPCLLLSNILLSLAVEMLLNRSIIAFDSLSLFFRAHTHTNRSVAHGKSIPLKIIYISTFKAGLVVHLLLNYIMNLRFG